MYETPLWCEGFKTVIILFFIKLMFSHKIVEGIIGLSLI